MAHTTSDDDFILTDEEFSAGVKRWFRSQEKAKKWAWIERQEKELQARSAAPRAAANPDLTQ